MEMLDRIYCNSTQTDLSTIFDLKDGFGYSIVQPIAEFNIKEAGKDDINMDFEAEGGEPFFGENIREAKAVLKDIFKK